MGLNTEQYRAMMWSLLPPSRLWSFVNTKISTLFRGLAIELSRLDNRASDLVRESVPAESIELLDEYEKDLGITKPSSNAEERSALVVARLLVRQQYRPVDFQVALSQLLGVQAESVVVIERTRSFCISVADDREIYRFFIYRNPLTAGSYFLSSAQKVVDDLKPAHTIGHVIESVSMICDNQYSLCDRDLIGL